MSEVTEQLWFSVSTELIVIVIIPINQAASQPVSLKKPVENQKKTLRFCVARRVVARAFI